MQLTMAAVAEHAAVQEDIVMAAVAEHVVVEKGIASVAAEPAGNEPATAGDTAGDAAGDGAGGDKPAEPCTKRRTRVKRDWTTVQCLRFARRALPSFFDHVHVDTPRKWIAQKTPGTALGRPRSLEPAAVLALADIVSRVCSRLCSGAGVLAELLNSHLATLGVQYRFSARQSQKFMRSLGYSFKKPKGELGKEWPEATTRTLRECQQKIEWTLHDAAITDRSRVINIDETCCKMLPLLQRGCLAGGE